MSGCDHPIFLRGGVILKSFHIFISAISLSFNAIAAPDGGTISMLHGTCTKLMAMGTETDPRFCDGKVFNAEFPNGRNGFTFLMEGKDGTSAVIGFFGDGNKQIHKDKDHAVQPIDRVHLTFNGSTDDLSAAGTCAFANPYMGVPVKIICTADTSNGRFAGSFTSNGKGPDITQP